MCHIRGMRRDDICLYLGPADRAELQALITNCNTARKLVWRSEIVLATADGQRPEVGGLGFARPGIKHRGAGLICYPAGDCAAICREGMNRRVDRLRWTSIRSTTGARW